MESQTSDSQDLRDQLLDAALVYVPFDGWGEATFRAAISDSGATPGLARAVCPRGAVDLALAFHARGDALMLARLQAQDLTAMRFRNRIAAAVRARIEAVDDKELVRRGTTLFALPQHAAEGARAIWGTADKIWTVLGDTSDDVNWYTKRMSLSAVYGATILYWLGDDSPDHQDTWGFLDRRIDNVLAFEKLKGRIRENPLCKPFLALPERVIGGIRAPKASHRTDLPGSLDADQADAP